MKSDCSRDTFDPRKHFSSVRMQQGRVQLDADWNEQHDIIVHRVRAEAADIVGWCGGPLHHAAFHIVSSPDELSAEARALPANRIPLGGAPPGRDNPDFLISAGHYYVDGILCENEQLTSYLRQPDSPGGKAISDPGLYIVYVDVWQRHLTALDDPSICEIALGGPDTATRTKTVWQVKYWLAGAQAAGNCLTTFADFDALIAPGDGRLSARAKPEQANTGPCIVPPGAGYRGLENQFYRVEVHDGGAGLDVVASTNSWPVTRVAHSDNQIRYSDGATSNVGQAVEIYSGKAGSDPLNGTVAHIAAKDAGSKTLTLDISLSGLTLDEPRLRPAPATYKWSRNNGAIVTAIESINGQEITVHDVGPDGVLGFKEGQWVEISDDATELKGLPGQLAQISKIDGAINLITLSVAPNPLSSQTGGVDKRLHPKLRGWDGVGAIKFHPASAQDHFLALEDGVQVRFFAGSYKSCDYWNIPARTATADTQSGNIEWPHDASGAPLPQLPSGIKHHYCRLAMLRWSGKQFDSSEDCRHLFPPVTELTSLFYVSGDGQEGLPGATLPYPLRVGVARGEIPVVGARVKFEVIGGSGSLQGGSPLQVATNSEGVASCMWTVGLLAGSQQLVRAELIDGTGIRRHLPILFSATIVNLTSIFYLGGDGQQGRAGAALPYPLRVGVARGETPVSGATVRFSVAAGGGTLQGLSPLGQATTNPEGVASCVWTIGQAGDQRVIAELIDGTGARHHLPIQFGAGIDGEPGVHIVEVVRLADGKPLINDTNIHLDLFAPGISIVCDDAIDPDTIRNRPTCFVTIEMPQAFAPVPFSSSPQIIHSLLYVLAADTDVQDKTIRLIVHDGTIEWLRRSLSNAMVQSQVPQANRALARLKLKGHFIWSAKDPDLFLDGEVFGLRRPKGAIIPPTELRLPQSGDRRRGGDFEMWFYLGFDPPNPVSFRVASVEFIATSPAPPHSSSAGVVTAPLTPPSRLVSFAAAENVNQLVVKFNRAIGAVTVGPPNLLQSLNVMRLGPANQPTQIPGTSNQAGPNEIRLVFVDPLPAGQYRLTVSGFGTIINPVFARDDGSMLDGDFNATPGGDFTLLFTASAPITPL
jgi:uncharacterized protein DUF6519